MREIEKRIVEEIATLLNSRSDQLLTRGITYRGPELETWREEESAYTSELRGTLFTSLNGQTILKIRLE